MFLVMAIMERSRVADLDLRVVDRVDGPEMLDRALAEVPDVVAIPIDHPTLHPLRLCREAGDRAPVTRVLVVAPPEHAAHAYQAVRVGAWGAIDPAAGPGELQAAAQAVTRGEAVLPARLAAWVLRELLEADATTEGPPAPDQLTITERTVLRLLAEGTSPTAVADHLGQSERVVGRHVGSAVARLHRRYRRPSEATGQVSPAVG